MTPTPKYKVALAQFPGGGVSRMETNAWIVRTVRKMDRDPRISEVVSLTYADTPIPMLRNRSVKDAAAAGCDYLLMIDSDMAPDIHPLATPFWDVAWEFLMVRRMDEREAEYALREGNGDVPRQSYPPATICAPYCGPPPDELVYVFHWTNRESASPNPNFRLEAVSRAHAAVKVGIEEMGALPTGLILYDMRVFEILPPPWFAYEYEDSWETQKATTEDVYQTRNASMLGLPQYCAWGCFAGHVKSKVVGRPTIVARDHVHHSLVEAVLRGVDSADRLMCLGEGDRVHKALHHVQADEGRDGVQPPSGGPPP